MVATPHSPDGTISYNALRHDEAVFAGLMFAVEKALQGASRAVSLSIAANILVKAMNASSKATRKKVLRAIAAEMGVTL